MVKNIPNSDPAEAAPSKLAITTGIVLILLSGVSFFAMLAIPMTSLSTANKGMFAGALFAAVQGFWWIGVAIIGPSAIGIWRTVRRRSSE